MNRLKFTLTTWIRSSPLRGEEGWVAHRPVMALAALLMGLVGFGVAARRRLSECSCHDGNRKPLDHHRSDL